MPVLQRSELQSSPLADLHAIASELGLEGFRAMRRDDLIGAILAAQGGEEPEDDREPDEVPSEEALEQPFAGEGEEASALADADGEAPTEDAEAPTEETEAVTDEEAAAVTDEEAAAVTDEEAAAAAEEVAEPAAEEVAEPAADEGEAVADEGEAVADEGEAVVEGEPEVAEEISDEAIATGVLDILANGSGFLRVDPAGQSRDDVYVSPAQIRRCELRAGDEVSGPMRPPRRNERHPSLVRVETVNGGDAEPPEERPWFGDLTPVLPTERLAAPAAFDSAPFGKGSRVAVGGPPGAGASTLLHEVVRMLAERQPDMSLQVVLAGVRPEEVGSWREGGQPVVGGSFERSPEAQAQAAELAVERAKRQAERGGHAAVVIDALDALPPGVRRRLFGAARATEEGGTVTIVAATGDDSEALRWATTRLVLEGRGPSGTLGAERLA
jgi:transcription termination factor Rho